MRFILTTLILFIISLPSYAEKSEPIQGQLLNGLKYTLLPLHNEKGHIEIRLRVNAGSVDENDDQAGVAHMVEHLVFRSTKAYPNGIMPHLHTQKWVRGKNYNAVTTSDSTTYLLTPVASAGLAKSLDILSQMMFYANLTQSDLNDERKIIMEEWRQGLGVGATMNEQRTAAVRADSRYTRHRVIGTPESIQSMPATQLQQFYQKWYIPNNMNLLIVGDIDPTLAKQEIQHYFGSIKAQTLPQRDYLEPRLSNRLLINKIQDVRSAVSQIAYVFRFDESKHREQTEQARYQRLVDRLALSALTQRLRNQAEQLPKGISAMTVRKSDIGRHTVALAIFASVEPTSHQLGLKQIFEEIERIKRFPITEEELNKQKSLIFTQIDNAKKHTGDRDFAKWVQAMVDTVLVDKPFLTQPHIAELTEPMLKKISVMEVNQRLQDWFSAEDRLVNYQPPRDTQIETITEQIVNALKSDVEKMAISPPQKEKEIVPMSLNVIVGKGKIIKETHFERQNVKHWLLSNGDKVIWLKSPLAKDKTLFLAQSSAGFNAKGLNAWQSQMASQLIAQNAPLDWEVEQLKHWKTLNKVNFSIKQSATKLVFEGSTENTKLADLLRLYYAYQMETKIKEGLDEAKESIANTINLQSEKNNDTARLKALSQLRFNVEQLDDTIPTKDSLTQLTQDTLNEQWGRIVGAPTTFYFVNDMSEGELKKLVSQFLSNLPRHQPFVSSSVLATEGKGETKFAMNIEPKDDVRLWSFTPYSWQGKDAVLIAVARNIAVKKLKDRLRDQQLGVYSLRFESMLNPETQRIESELSFVANPEKTDKLIEQARSVLTRLSSQITEDDVEQEKKFFVSGEKERLKDINTWLLRLVLSETQFSDPRYLTEMQYLTDEITFDKVKVMADRLYNPSNEKVFIVTPKK